MKYYGIFITINTTEKARMTKAFQIIHKTLLNKCINLNNWVKDQITYFVEKLLISHHQ